VQFDLLVLFLGKTLFQLLNIFYGLLALVVGLFIAQLFQRFIVFILNLLKFDDLLKYFKFKNFLDKGDVKQSPSQLIGALVYWLVIYLLIVGVAFFAGLPVDLVLGKVFSSLGIILLAAVVLSIGSFLGVLFGYIVYVITANFGMPGAKTISRLTQYATVVMAFLLALEQLGIGPSLLIPSIGVIIGSLGLAVAIAFGLGCKDIMADFVSNLIKGK